MKEIIGKLEAQGLKFAIVVSRFNEMITGRLLDGCMDALKRLGAAENSVFVVRVPGSFEIPQAAFKLAKSGKYDAVICLGALDPRADPSFRFLERGGDQGHCALGPGNRGGHDLRSDHRGYH